MKRICTLMMVLLLSFAMWMPAYAAELNRINGTSGNDTIEGTEKDDLIYGYGGQDKIYGKAGDDELHGGDESGADNPCYSYSLDDEIYGEAGDDKLYGEYGIDKLYGGDGRDELHGGEDYDELYGGTGDDELHGEYDHDYLYGEEGNDVLYGGDGDDVLKGSRGYDLLDGGMGRDFLSGGDGEDDLYGGTGDDQLCGGIGKDTIDGGDGDDFISGDGDSKYYGKPEYDSYSNYYYMNDTLTGGEGKDTFEFQKGCICNDIITDAADEDTLRILGAARNDLSAERDGHDLIIRVGEEESITLKDWAKNNSRLQWITLGDESAISISELLGDNRISISPAATLLVYESNLPGGTSPDNTKLTKSGTITCYSPSGISYVEVDGTRVGAETIIPNDCGVLRTGFDATTGCIDYVYTLNQANYYTQLKFSVVVSDKNGSAVSVVIPVIILDDAPVASDISCSVTKGATEPEAVNILKDCMFGADGPAAVGAVSVENSGKGKFGTLTADQDGTYSYILNNDHEDVKVLKKGQTLEDTFIYTLTDRDGSTASAKLTVTINGNESIDKDPGTGDNGNGGTGDNGNSGGGNNGGQGGDSNTSAQGTDGSPLTVVNLYSYDAVGMDEDAFHRSVLGVYSDEDIKGSTFGKLRAKGMDKGTKKILIRWSKTAGAAKYVLYGNRCSGGKKYAYKKIKSMGAGARKCAVTKIAGKKLKKATFYKFKVAAIDSNGKVIAVSKTLHVTTGGGKYGNAKSVRKVSPKKAKVSIKAGKSKKLKTREVMGSKKIARHKKVAWESSNIKVATVKNGKVKARGKGKCKVWAYAQNGAYTTYTVTVK